MKKFLANFAGYLLGAGVLYQVSKSGADVGYRFWVITLGIFGVSLFLPLVFKDLKRKNGDVNSKDKLGSRAILKKGD
ncbi:MAG: hypothetical protein SOZ22_00030 [Ezakiella sp.]|nr:hypothetical protein [Ezakiella sp.]